MLQQSTNDNDFLGGVDWEALFVPNEPLVELILRGSIAFLTLCLFLRIALKRESGTLGVTDLLVAVLIADAAQDGLAVYAASSTICPRAHGISNGRGTFLAFPITHPRHGDRPRQHDRTAPVHCCGIQHR